jgi:hypothetical protein
MLTVQLLWQLTRILAFTLICNSAYEKGLLSFYTHLFICIFFWKVQGVMPHLISKMYHAVQNPPQVQTMIFRLHNRFLKRMNPTHSIMTYKPTSPHVLILCTSCKENTKPKSNICLQSFNWLHVCMGIPTTVNMMGMQKFKGEETPMALNAGFLHLM